MPSPAPGNVAADRNLLFGILAVQMDFVSRDQLIAAMHGWVLAKHRSLGELLQEQGALTADRLSLLVAMVDEHIKAHSGDVQRSLAAVAHHSTLGDMAQSLADPDVQASLAVAGATLATTAEERPAEDGLRYRILRPHAQGGLGVVSVARDAELGREVAFKEIQVRYAEDPNLRGRFVREAEITGGLEHPGIVPVYGLGRYADGRPYYAMRFIRGESLQEAIKKLHDGDTGYTLRGLLTRFVAACNAVAYAHSRGVIHRDLKPANVMLGPYGETLVVDWGLAKVVGRELDGSEPTLQPPSGEGSLTQAGSALGTPAYMSPEQARGEIWNLGPATDIYSLGATLYAILTGRPPVQERDTPEILEKVRNADWVPPRQIQAGVPRPLDAICGRAMALGSAERYRSLLELAGDVEGWLADEPVKAWNEPWLTRTSRWVRRHRTSVAAGLVAGFVTLVLGVVGLIWELRVEALQNRREASQHRGSALMAQAQVDYSRKRYADSARRWREAFAADPGLAQPNSDYVGLAAYAAAAAGCGEGEDPPGSRDERESLRQQALVWFRTLLADSQSDRMAMERSAHWLKTCQLADELAEVHESDRLAFLPPEERQQWARLWTEAKPLIGKIPPVALVGWPVRGDPGFGRRYLTACKAVVTTREREDVASAEASGQLRRRARGWLRSELADLSVLNRTPTERKWVGKQLRDWLMNEDLACVRDASALQQLGEPEATDWLLLWQEIRSVEQSLADAK
jgi:serine/threonine protein kinase